MEAERRKYAMLGVLALVLVVATYRAWPTGTSGTPAQSSNQQGERPGPSRATKPAEAPDVHLSALETERPRPGPSSRNLFRFERRTPPPPPSASRPAPPEALTPLGPPPPALAPITFKFIGVVDAPDQATKIAVLSDGRNVFHGREGDIIEGRYRIVHIGAESIEMAYLDGRGRQSIRLTGS